MTETINADDKQVSPRRRGLSPLQKSLFGVLAFFFVIHIVFWYLEFHAGIVRCRVHHVGRLRRGLFRDRTCAAVAPASRPARPDQVRTTQCDGHRLGLHRLDPTIHLGTAVALAFRPDQDRRPHRALWTYMWSPILLGGDARYLNGDPLIVVLEWIAFFVGLFEAYAMVQFFRNGKRFTSTQLSFIMGGMIVEVTLPAVYFGVEIANNLQSMTSPVEMWIKFVVLNLLWCTMPFVTYFWGVRRLARQDLAVKF